MRARIVDNSARWGGPVDVKKALIIVVRHRPAAGVLDICLLRPRHVPDIGCLVEERGFISLIATRARYPLMISVRAADLSIGFAPTAGVSMRVGVVPSVIVAAAVADWKSPFAGQLCDQSALRVYRASGTLLPGRSTLSHLPG